MICKNCGANCPDNISYCENCGAPVYQEQQYQQNEPYTMPNYGTYGYNSYNQPQQIDNAVSMGTYLKWFLLGTLLGPISIVIAIVFACMTENRNRANFFRALLVIWAISIVVAIVAVIMIAVVGFSIIGFSDSAPILDAYDSFYYYDEFLKIASFVKF